jgi:hypothetical protein
MRENCKIKYDIVREKGDFIRGGGIYKGVMLGTLSKNIFLTPLKRLQPLIYQHL